jgi:hypothetical protein
MVAVNETATSRGIVRVLLQKLPSACWYPYPPEVADPLGESKASARQFPERGLLQKGYRPLPRSRMTWELDPLAGDHPMDFIFGSYVSNGSCLAGSL